MPDRIDVFQLLNFVRERIGMFDALIERLGLPADRAWRRRSQFGAELPLFGERRIAYRLAFFRAP
jgi:hypothetical protein